MQFRDLMAPDTDPTDEELAIVSQEALAIAMERRATYDKWIATALQDATAESDKHRLHRRPANGDEK